jgi:hypothetical protein
MRLNETGTCLRTSTNFIFHIIPSSSCLMACHLLVLSPLSNMKGSRLRSIYSLSQAIFWNRNGKIVYDDEARVPYFTLLTLLAILGLEPQDGVHYALFKVPVPDQTPPSYPGVVSNPFSFRDMQPTIILHTNRLRMRGR